MSDSPDTQRDAVRRQPDGMLSGPGMMLLSAAIFGYFGFAVTWLSTGSGGQFLLFVAILEWTLKVTAIVFLVSGLLTVVRPWLGNLLYSLAGLASAASFAVVLILDLMDSQHQAISPLLLLIFAAWNGFGSWSSLRAVLTAPERAQAPS